MSQAPGHRHIVCQRREHTDIASSSSLIVFLLLHSVTMIPSLSFKAFADSHVVLEAQRSQAKCSVCQEFYGNGWMGRRAHRQTSYLRELIQDIVSLSQIILSQIRGGFRVRTFADPYGDQRRGLKCGAGTCQYPMCEACWNETMESCPQCRRIPNPYG